MATQKAKTRLKIINLFGDGGRYAGQINRGQSHEMHFWKYYFDDYMPAGPMGASREVDREKLSETVDEAFGGKYGAAACDSNDALLLQFCAAKKGLPPLPFFINDVDRLELAGEVREFIVRHYREDFFPDFLASSDNHWMHIVQGRAGFYEEAGIDRANLYYLPMCSASIEFTFPNFFAAAEKTLESPALRRLKGKIIAAGSHNRDFATLAEAASGTGLEIHVITNLSLNRPIETSELTWHDSLPEAEYMQALRDADAVVVPLRDGGRAAGQLACAIPMKLGAAVIATETESVNDLVEDGVTGYTFPAGSPGGLREKLFRIQNNPKEKARIAAAAQKKEKELSEAASANLARLLNALTAK